MSEPVSARRREAGIAAEHLACAFLERQGMAVVARNYRCRLGEIDIVARDGETLVFVEVRLRSRSRFGGAAESIDAPKQRRLVAAARHFLMRAGGDRTTRFDAVLLDGLDERRIDWRRGVIGN